VDPAFVSATGRAAVEFAAGGAPEVSDGVLDLARGATRAMSATKLAQACGALAACAGLALGAVWAGGPAPPPAAPVAVAAANKPEGTPDSVARATTAGDGGAAEKARAAAVAFMKAMKANDLGALMETVGTPFLTDVDEEGQKVEEPRKLRKHLKTLLAFVGKRRLVEFPTSAAGVVPVAALAEWDTEKPNPGRRRGRTWCWSSGCGTARPKWSA
jgi:hypothetical protein